MESLLDSMTITLSRPFIIKGESCDTITIREPKLRDRIMFSNDKSGLEERTATMLARPGKSGERGFICAPRVRLRSTGGRV